MLKNYIHIHRWSNALQQYEYTGHLLYDEEFTQGAVTFHYDKSYIGRGGPSLDPYLLNSKGHEGVYVVNSGKGILPPYFQQFLPGALGQLVVQNTFDGYNQLNQFQKLSISTEMYGERGALHFNGQNDQNNDRISSLSELSEAISSLTSKEPNNILNPMGESYLSICSATGTRTKLELSLEGDLKRFFYKHAESSQFDEHKMRKVMYDMEREIGIDSVECKLVELGRRKIALQANYRYHQPQSENGGLRIKLNSVPFSALIDTSDGKIDNVTYSYQDAKNIIEAYSAEPEEDKAELFRRALLSAAINNTSNGIENLELVDIGHEHWRLAPAFNSMPNPCHSTSFRMKFSDAFAAKKFFSVDLAFADKLAQELSVTGIEVEDTLNTVNRVSHSFEDMAKLVELDIESVIALRDAIGSGSNYHQGETLKRGDDPSPG